LNNELTSGEVEVAGLSLSPEVFALAKKPN
jgi:hypothetical protein